MSLTASIRRTARQLQVDAERMSALQLTGHLVPQDTSRALVAGAAAVIADVRRSLALDAAA